MTTPLNDRKKRARKHIKLLEKADQIALSNLSKKVLKPEYRKVLTNQDDQLKYYLSTYKTPEELPTRIVTEYEFPKFFHYTVNSKKNGLTPKRTRLDSNMFRKFMQNKAKRELAIAQGIPIGIVRPPKNTPNQDFNLYDLYGMQEEPELPQQIQKKASKQINPILNAMINTPKNTKIDDGIKNTNMYDKEKLIVAIEKYYGQMYGTNPHVENMNIGELKKFMKKENIPLLELHKYYNSEILGEIDELTGNIKFQEMWMDLNPDIPQKPMIDSIKYSNKAIDELSQKMLNTNPKTQKIPIKQIIAIDTNKPSTYLPVEEKAKYKPGYIPSIYETVPMVAKNSEEQAFADEYVPLIVKYSTSSGGCPSRYDFKSGKIHKNDAFKLAILLYKLKKSGKKLDYYGKRKWLEDHCLISKYGKVKELTEYGHQEAKELIKIFWPEDS